MYCGGTSSASVRQLTSSMPGSYNKIYSCSFSRVPVLRVMESDGESQAWDGGPGIPRW